MADFVADIARGRAGLYHDNVEQNVPTGCKLVIVAMVSTDTDTARTGAATLSALLALGSTVEATNSGYARIDLAAADITQTIGATNSDQDITVNPVFTSIVAGSNWTHIAICYSPGAASADTLVIPLTIQDFVVTPNGGDITLEINANGYYRAS